MEGIKAIDSFEEATASHDKKLLALLKRSQQKNAKRKNVRLNNKEKLAKSAELLYIHMGVV